MAGNQKEILKKLTINDFEDIFKILQESFPLDEYRTYDEHKALFKRQEYSVYGLKDGDRVKGFISVYDFGDFLYAEHFAVAKKYRCCGLGSCILGELEKLAGDRQIVLEVELPTEEIARRRIGFYERNGFYYNDYDYIQPSITFGRNEIPLSLMTTYGKIDLKRFEFMRRVIYLKVYGKVI